MNYVKRCYICKRKVEKCCQSITLGGSELTQLKGIFGQNDDPPASYLKENKVWVCSVCQAIIKESKVTDAEVKDAVRSVLSTAMFRIQGSV